MLKKNKKGENKMTLKYENTANVGDVIRAYDFANYGNNECYLEGLVVDKGLCDDKYYACYKVKLTKKISGNKDITDRVLLKGADVWYVPFETCDDNYVYSDDKLNDIKITRIVKLEGGK